MQEPRMGSGRGELKMGTCGGCWGWMHGVGAGWVLRVHGMGAQDRSRGWVRAECWMPVLGAWGGCWGAVGSSWVMLGVGAAPLCRCWDDDSRDEPKKLSGPHPDPCIPSALPNASAQHGAMWRDADNGERKAEGPGLQPPALRHCHTPHILPCIRGASKQPAAVQGQSIPSAPLMSQESATTRSPSASPAGGWLMLILGGCCHASLLPPTPLPMPEALQGTSGDRDA